MTRSHNILFLVLLALLMVQVSCVRKLGTTDHPVSPQLPSSATPVP